MNRRCFLHSFLPGISSKKNTQRCQASCQSPIRPGRAIFSEMMSRWAMQLRFSQRKGVRMSYTSFDAYSLFGRWRTLNQSLITCYKLQANVAPTKHENKLAFSKVFKSIWLHVILYSNHTHVREQSDSHLSMTLGSRDLLVFSMPSIPLSAPPNTSKLFTTSSKTVS